MLLKRGYNISDDGEPRKILNFGWEFLIGDGGAGQKFGLRWGENAGAMFRQQPEPRGGG